jgi:NitT/TauT family transport system permease protein
MNTKTENIVYKILKLGIVSWIIIFVFWHIASLFYDEYFLPSPYETLQGVIILIKNGTLWTDIVASVSRSAKGWFLGIIIAVPLGLLVGSLTTLFLMWFGVGDSSKVALIFYATFFSIFVNTIAGVASTDDSLVEAASCMGAGRLRIFFTITIPSAIPNIFTGIRLGLSGAILCVIAAEMLAGNDGLGYLIQSSKLYYKTSWSFAGIITLALIGFCADRILIFLGRNFLKHFGVR